MNEDECEHFSHCAEGTFIFFRVLNIAEDSQELTRCTSSSPNPNRRGWYHSNWQSMYLNRPHLVLNHLSLFGEDNRNWLHSTNSSIHAVFRTSWTMLFESTMVFRSQGSRALSIFAERYQHGATASSQRGIRARNTNAGAFNAIRVLAHVLEGIARGYVCLEAGKSLLRDRCWRAVTTLPALCRGWRFTEECGAICLDVIVPD